MAGFDPKFFTAKDDPHPQADSDWGLDTIAKALLIISCWQSIVDPCTISKDVSSTTTLDPFLSNSLKSGLNGMKWKKIEVDKFD